MKRLASHLKNRRRVYIEIGVAVIVILAAALWYHYEENNFEAYLAEHFPNNGLSLAEVLSVSRNNDPKLAYPMDNVVVQFLTGDNQGQTTTVIDELVSSSTQNSYLELVPGEKVLLARSIEYSGTQYYVTDRYRLPEILFIVLLFAIVAVLFGRIRGLTSIVGLGMSVVVLMFFVVPQILNGNDPLTICVAGAALIALVSLYFAHGFNKRTTIALAGTLITLVISTFLAVGFVMMSHLIGLATDESFYIEVGKGVGLNLRGILLGGIIIGALGVLDDVTIGQSAAVSEIKDANSSLNTKELYRRGMSIGREHIASLINTLFLAYAGVALPTILYIAAFQGQIPLWLTLNGESIAEEIVRTMVGSIGIILAVPITTLLAAYYYGKKSTQRTS